MENCLTNKTRNLMFADVLSYYVPPFCLFEKNFEDVAIVCEPPGSAWCIAVFRTIYIYKYMYKGTAKQFHTNSILPAAPIG